jgi:N6-L-threonylcarbamoyladenine synthase
MQIDKNVEKDGVIFMSIKDEENSGAHNGNSQGDKNVRTSGCSDEVGAEPDVTILAIESSCDETAAAVVRNGREVLSNIISSQIALHTIYGGVVPEIASRKHVEKINGCIRAALNEAGVTLQDIDAVAVTYGPGLVGALLVGVSEAKAISFATGKPLIGVHHIEGHIYANFIENKDLEPPFVCLVASGGHSHLVLVKDYGEIEIIGQTRDDAAGEAFDKIARAIGLGYPGGPKIDKAAREGNPDAYSFPRAQIPDAKYDFSFSGLKSAVLNLINQDRMQGKEINQADIAASFQKAVVEVLVDHSVEACREYGYDKLAIAGGVASNSLLREQMEKECAESGIRFYRPSPLLCTDNAAMIGAAGYYEYKKGVRFGLDMNAVPNLSLGSRERRFHAGSVK